MKFAAKRKIVEILAWINEPKRIARLNGWAALFWLVAGIPIAIYFSESVKFLVWISVWALFTTHYSLSRQGVSELKQQNDLGKILEIAEKAPPSNTDEKSS